MLKFIAGFVLGALLACRIKAGQQTTTPGSQLSLQSLVDAGSSGSASCA